MQLVVWGFPPSFENLHHPEVIPKWKVQRSSCTAAEINSKYFRIFYQLAYSNPEDFRQLSGQPIEAVLTDYSSFCRLSVITRYEHVLHFGTSALNRSFRFLPANFFDDGWH